ncbi:hypothetical protein [Oceanicola sp. 22II-s10i]|nr:hypothetical protein [Oceanicola sp. 22II-s10i]
MQYEMSLRHYVTRGCRELALMAGLVIVAGALHAEAAQAAAPRHHR